MKPDRTDVLALLRDVTGCASLAADAELIESGLLDSLSFVLLLTRIEDEWDAELQPTQIPPDVWRTPDTFAAYLCAQGICKE